MAAVKLYVGNLNYRTTEDKLKELFSQYGEVSSVNILQGRGFGFVEMSNPEGAGDAKTKLNGTEFDGRRIIVNDAADIWIYNTKWYGPTRKEVKGMRFCPVGDGQECRWLSFG